MIIKYSRFCLLITLVITLSILAGCSADSVDTKTEDNSEKISEYLNKKEAAEETVESKDVTNTSETPKSKQTFSEEELENNAAISLTVQLMIGGYSDRFNIDRTGYRVDSITETSSGWLVNGTLIFYDYRGNPTIGSFTVRFTEGSSTGSCDIYI